MIKAVIFDFNGIQSDQNRSFTKLISNRVDYLDRIVEHHNKIRGSQYILNLNTFIRIS